jgi:hypothetical protein
MWVRPTAPLRATLAYDERLPGFGGPVIHPPPARFEQAVHAVSSQPVTVVNGHRGLVPPTGNCL